MNEKKSLFVGNIFVFVLPLWMLLGQENLLGEMLVF